MSTQEGSFITEQNAALVSDVDVDELSELAASSLEEEAVLEALELNPKQPSVVITDNGDEYVIEYRKARFVENDNRERASVTVRRTRKVANDETAVTVENRNAKANIAFAKTIATRVLGYDVDDAQKWLDADLVVECEVFSDFVGRRVSELSREERQHFARELKNKRASRVIDEVPAPHLLALASNYFGGDFTVEKPKGRRVANRHVAREVIVVQAIGSVVGDDGRKTPPVSVVRWALPDVDAETLAAYEASAIQGTTYVENGGTQREERVVSVETCSKLFDRNIRRVEGAVVDGEACDVKNEEHLKLIDDGLKKDVVIFWVNATKVEAKNSSTPSSRG